MTVLPCCHIIALAIVYMTSLREVECTLHACLGAQINFQDPASLSVWPILNQFSIARQDEAWLCRILGHRSVICVRVLGCSSILWGGVEVSVGWVGWESSLVIFGPWKGDGVSCVKFKK